MQQLALIILCSALLLILHTYLFYPLGMIFLFSKPRKVINANAPDNFPEVAILIAAYNEERVIGQKIRSVYASNYPIEKISVYVGSDASDDNTDQIVRELQKEFANLHLIPFVGRVGKIGIINRLQEIALSPFLVLTDANVIFKPGTLSALLLPFQDVEVGLVAANIVKVSDKNSGIALQEKKYLSLENRIKAAESNAFRLIMGAEGGCYALRKELFSPVPDNFIVDDFFITMRVLERGKATLFHPTAICTEDAPEDDHSEYRRKVRISSGNFQNLVYFAGQLLTIWRPLSFCFWSHKVLRWFTPTLLIIALLSCALLIPFSKFFLVLFILQILGLLSPVFTTLFGIRNQAFKFISHFYLMNFALLQGFLKFVTGIKTNIWQPVKRNV